MTTVWENVTVEPVTSIRTKSSPEYPSDRLRNKVNEGFPPRSVCVIRQPMRSIHLRPQQAMIAQIPDL